MENDEVARRLRQQLAVATRAVRPRLLQLPWEQGWLAATVGGLNAAGSDLWNARLPTAYLTVPPSTLPPTTPGPSDQAVQAGAPVGGTASFSVARRRLAGLAWPQLSERRRQRALARWRLILECNPLASAVGEQLMQLSRCQQDDAGEMLANVFSAKSTGTLDRRAGAILLYIAWHSRHVTDQAPLPPSELHVYRYLAEMAAGSGPATRADSLLRALVLAKYLIGLQGVDEVVGSARVKGAAHRAYLRKRPTKQCQVLTVDMVRSLECLVSNANAMVDRYAAGFFLFMLFGRARFSDAQSALSFRLDLAEDGEGFLEACASHCKTANTKERKTRLLPVAAPAIGVSTVRWAELWMMVARSLGDFRTETGRALPAPAGPSSWSVQPLTSLAASKWLRALLVQAGYTEKDLSGISTHSLKSTSLSWAAKYGVNPNDRRLLGYHVAPQDATMIVYSRDAMSGPLRRFVEVVAAIRSGRFYPDTTRSGYLTQQGAEIATEAEAEGPQGDAESEATDCTVFGEVSSSEGGMHEGAARGRPRTAAMLQGDPRTPEAKGQQSPRTICGGWGDSGAGDEGMQDVSLRAVAEEGRCSASDREGLSSPSTSEEEAVTSCGSGSSASGDVSAQSEVLRAAQEDVAKNVRGSSTGLHACAVKSFTSTGASAPSMPEGRETPRCLPVAVSEGLPL